MWRFVLVKCVFVIVTAGSIRGQSEIRFGAEGLGLKVSGLGVRKEKVSEERIKRRVACAVDIVVSGRVSMNKSLS